MKKMLPLLLLVFCPTAIFAVDKDVKNNIDLDIDTIQILHDVEIVGYNAKTIAGSGQYINTRTLSKTNQININNVLRNIPGVNVRDEEGYGLRPNIGLRGTPVNRSAKITLMEDGILVAPAPYADPSAYYFPTFSRMQGVEVLKGSSQVKYGPYTVGGAVNLLSTAIPDAFKAFAQVSYGSFNTNQQRIWVGDSKTNFDYVFEFNRFASNGFKQLDGGGNTGFERRDVMGKFRWHSNSDAAVAQSLTLKVLNATELGNETYLGLSYADFIENPLRRYAATQKDLLDMEHSHISLSYNIQPVQGLVFNATAYYANTYRDWARANSVGGQSVTTIINDPASHQLPYQILTGKADGAILYQSAARNYFSKGVQANARYFFCAGETSSKIELGMRYHADQADRLATRSTYNMTGGKMILASAGISGNNENQIRSAGSLAAYFSYGFFYNGLKLSPGVRYERINFDIQNYGNADFGRLGTNLKSATNELAIFLPGVGVSYDINTKMNVFAGVHKGFSPPGMPNTNTNAEQAKEETAMNYELGYRLNATGLSLQLVGFSNNYNNILGSDNVSGGGAGTGDMFNAGNAVVQGLEFSLEYNFMQLINSNQSFRVPLDVAYTYTNAKFAETFVNGGGDWGSGLINAGDFIPFITPHLLTTSLGVENNKMSLVLIARYIGQTRVKPSQGEIALPDADTKLNEINAIGSDLVLDLSANYKFNKTITAFCTINNITNNMGIITNLPQGYRPNMPFNLNVGLKADI
jgi:Fe(3+) dicitrate transport protein